MPVLVAASACWDGRQLRGYPWPSTSTVRFCDSGGFVFGRTAGSFPFDFDEYYPNLAPISGTMLRYGSAISSVASQE